MKPIRIDGVIMFNWAVATEEKLVNTDGKREILKVPARHAFRVFENDEEEIEAVSQGLYIWHEVIHLNSIEETTEAGQTRFWKWSDPEEEFFPFRVNILKDGKIHKWQKPEGAVLGDEAISEYLKDGRVKVCLGICRGKQLHDKRDSIAKRDSEREIQRALRDRQKR